LKTKIKRLASKHFNTHGDLKKFQKQCQNKEWEQKQCQNKEWEQKQCQNKEWEH